MSGKTKIEWTECSWNPITGCSKISDGCKNCYAERLSKRLVAMKNPRYINGFDVTIHSDLIEAPKKWKTPRKIFVNSMSDLFHEKVPEQTILDIFETMNEPRLCGTNHEWWFDANAADCKDAAACLNEYNQLVVDTIRASGGNNAKRMIACPALAASPDSAFAAAFKMPTDDAPDKLIVSVHMYTPYSFAMQSPGERTFTSSHKANLVQYFGKLNTRFISKGYPVYIGEFGATNKDNLEDRVAWFDYFIRESRKYGMTSMLWDNGVWEVKNNDYNEHYGFYNRREQTWYFPEILAAMTAAANVVIE